MRRPARTLLILATLATAALCPSCARRPSLPSDNVGYDAAEAAAAEAAVDLRSLAGRHVLLDPGHGGAFRGVVGRDGLSEADANLGVALYLRGLLEAHGARVSMTRTDDRDFLTPADSSLSADLAARVALCDSLRPDVFVSLHHNSNAELDRERNETQTYYPVGRDGADQDLARAVHRHLARLLGIRPARIMAGNFHVLRNAPVPAVLGEPSMLSNPGVEARLVEAAALEIEARAYLLGLAEYFAGGQPAWTPHDPAAWSDGRARWRFDPGPGGPPLDPAAVVLTVDGRTVPHEIDAAGRTLSWAADALPSGGIHPTTLRGRNLAGRATALLLDTLIAPAGAARLEIAASLERGDGGALLTWRSRCPDGSPCPLSESILLTCGPEPLRLGARGEISGVVHLAEIDASFPSLVGDAGEAPASPVLTTLDTLPAGLRWTPLSPAEGPAWSIRLLADCDGSRTPPTVSDRSLAWLAAGDSQLVWLERPGWGPLLRLPACRWGLPLVWRPWNLNLVGRTIVIDPAGGAADDQGVGPLGTPGRELNLRTAERLAALLRGAGAEVLLTRTDVHRRPDQEKVLLANRAGADLFLTVARHDHDDDVRRLRYHHGSRNGERWARASAAALADLEHAVDVGPSYAYLLRHTAPPALRLEAPLPRDERNERRATRPAVQQAEALALLRAVLAYFDEDDGLPPALDIRSLIRRHPEAFPADVDLIRVDGNLIWLPDEAGSPAPAPRTSDVPILEVRTGDSWRLLEYDAAADRVRILLEGEGEAIVAGGR